MPASRAFPRRDDNHPTEGGAQFQHFGALSFLSIDAGRAQGEGAPRLPFSRHRRNKPDRASLTFALEIHAREPRTAVERSALARAAVRAVPSSTHREQSSGDDRARNASGRLVRRGRVCRLKRLMINCPPPNPRSPHAETDTSSISDGAFRVRTIFARELARRCGRGLRRARDLKRAWRLM